MPDPSRQLTLQSSDLPALDRQVLEHSRHWLLTGISLRCTACGAGQTASEANHVFVHQSHCPRAVGRDHPWHELACILHWVPSQNLVLV